MKEIKGYTHEHFVGDKPIQASTFFELVNLIKEDHRLQAERQKKAENESRRKSKSKR